MPTCSFYCSTSVIFAVVICILAGVIFQFHILQDQAWKQDVRNKLTSIFQDQPEDLLRIFRYLEEEEKAHHENKIEMSKWNALRSALNTEKFFKEYAQNLANEIRVSPVDAEVEWWLIEMHEKIDSGKHLTDHEKKEAAAVIGASVGFTKAWSYLPMKSKIIIIDRLWYSTKIGSIRVITIPATGRLAQLASGMGSASFMLPVVYLARDVKKQIERWSRGEITGKRAAKNVITSLVATGAAVGGGAAGAYVGASLGSFAGPIGAAVGSIVGGIAGGTFAYGAAESVMDHLFEYIFGLPKDEALDKAYQFLGVSAAASNADISKAYHKLVLRYHPDNGGSNKELTILNVFMQMIKEARGQRY